MDERRKIEIIRLLERNGFEERKPDIWVRGEAPDMWLVDLGKVPPEVALVAEDGFTRITEGHGIAELERIKNMVDNILREPAVVGVSKSQQFKNLKAVAREEREVVSVVSKAPAPSVESKGGFLTPAASLDEAMRAFELFEQAKTKLLGDSDVLWIGSDGKPTQKGQGHPHIKRSGWRKLARFFGINCTIIHREKIWSKDSEGEYYIWKYTVRAQHPSGGYFDAEGVCSSRDPFFSKKHGQRIEPDEADIMLKAQTVAFNRAVSDLLGSGEVSVEELGEDVERGV
jgi:hypothetical protein